MEGACRQRLALAEMISHSSVSLTPVVVMDDSFAEQLPEDVQVYEADPDVVDVLAAKLYGDGSVLTKAEAQKYAEDIAWMVANAPEPYKSLFLKYLPMLEFYDTTSGAMLNPLSRAIHIDLTTLADDMPAPYHTFFHEFGHQIDLYENISGYMKFPLNWETSGFEYDGADGQPHSIEEYLSMDADASIAKILATKFPGIDKDQADRVRDAIMNTNPNFLNGWVIGDSGYPDFNQPPLTGSDADAFDRLRSYYKRSDVLGNNVAQTASDCISAMTGSKITGSYGHASYYWLAPEATGFPEKEFWAGYFADNMTNRRELADLAAPNTVIGGATSSTANLYKRMTLGMTGLDATKALFPGASAAAAAMAKEMAK